MNSRNTTSKPGLDRNDSPGYLERLKTLGRAFPALRGFSQKVEGWQGLDGELASSHFNGANVVHTHVNQNIDIQVRRMYASRNGGRPPGRCALLIFKEDLVESEEFLDPRQVTKFFETSATPKNQCRLWILEDLQPDWINVLGGHLGVDPLVFSEQSNSWNYTDSDSVPTRTLPSLIDPERSFTLRYYEIRRLHEAYDITHLGDHKTFAINWRRFERWRAIDPPSLEPLHRPQHGFVRRCASFWTNQQPGEAGWDAVMLVDPAFESLPWRNQNNTNGQVTPTSVGCTILRDPLRYMTIAELWKGRAVYNNKRQETPVVAAQDMSVAYHAGSTTFADLTSQLSGKLARASTLDEISCRDFNSPLDEIVYHWTYIANAELISAARISAVRSASYLLKYIANQWTNQLELIAAGASESEFFADDHQATLHNVNGNSSEREIWKTRLSGIIHTTEVINYQKRQLNNFVQAINLNLERLGFTTQTDSRRHAPAQIILDAQIDFLTLRDRLVLLSDRISNLTNVANDLASLQTAFKSIEDGEFALRLSLFASVVFPMTLVTSMLSMGEGFLPGQSQFWVFWAVSVPLVTVFSVGLMFGRRPERWVREWWRVVRERSYEKEYQE